MEMEPQLSLRDNIKTNIAKKGAFLYEEVIFILKEELREPKIYFSVLKEISLGKTKLNDIKNVLGVERTLLTRYIETLETLDLIEKQIPVTSKPKSKNTIYFLKDNFFRFWFRFVFPYKKDLERNNNKNFLGNLKRNLDSFIGHSFEQICQEFLLKSELLFHADKIGRQWGRMPKEHKSQYEIDICAINEKTKEILFAECKWKEKANGISILNELKEKAKYVQWNSNKREEYYIIFAKISYLPNHLKIARFKIRMLNSLILKRWKGFLGINKMK